MRGVVLDHNREHAAFGIDSAPLREFFGCLAVGCRIVVIRTERGDPAREAPSPRILIM
ncbi:hypothetical protein [Nocardia barduliensis]|uniref:hypothetical protein n=1 Tax=Nocardia barduliensis TaxID=2736643 RepID=UPI0015747B3F|nr:hypothetical protein [Nocardia barduliensis]